MIQNEKNGGVKFSSIVRTYHQWIEVGRDAGIRNHIQNRHSIVVSRNARRGLQEKTNMEDYETARECKQRIRERTDRVASEERNRIELWYTGDTRR